MAFKLADLFVSISAQTKDFDRSLTRARKDLIATGDASARSAAFELPAPRAAGGGGGDAAGAGAAQMSELAGSLLPLGAKIQSAIVGAMAPLNQFAARFSAQFEAVGATVIGISKRIDDHLRFPAAEKTLTGLRKYAAARFVDIDGDATRLGRSIDRTLGGIQAFKKLTHQFDLMGSAVKSSFSKVGSVKLGNINFDNSTRSVLNLRNAANSAGSAFRGMGGQVALALGAFGLVFKAVGFLKDGIKSASALGETVSKVGTVFGSQTAMITDMADRMAARYGLVKGPLLDAAAGFGLIGKAAGQSHAAAAGLSTQMTALAADVSSFYNIPMDVALEKLRSGLVGESEPMRALGVLLNEDAVKAEALRLGLTRGSKALTEQAKVQARASLIAAGLTDATGDLERTQGSAANQFRKFQGTIVNLGTSIGTALLPAITTGIGLLNEFAAWATSAFAGAKGDIDAFAAGLGTAFNTVGILFRNWAAVFEIARLQIVQGLNNLVEWFEVLGPNITQVAAYIGRNWYQLIADSFRQTLALLQNLWKNFQAVGTGIGNVLAGKEFTVNWTPMLDGFKATAEKLPEIIRPVLSDMSKEIAAVTDQIGRAEAERNRKLSGPAQPAAKGTLDENGKPAAAKAEKSKVSDIAEFARSLQMAVGGKAQAAERGAKAAERTAKAVEQLPEKLKPILAAGGGIAGPAWQMAGMV